MFPSNINSHLWRFALFFCNLPFCYPSHNTEIEARVFLVFCRSRRRLVVKDNHEEKQTKIPLTVFIECNWNTEGCQTLRVPAYSNQMSFTQSKREGERERLGRWTCNTEVPGSTVYALYIANWSDSRHLGFLTNFCSIYNICCFVCLFVFLFVRGPQCKLLGHH